MIRVTWAWLGQTPALDLANTVAVERNVERDLLAPVGAYERWAATEAEARTSADVVDLLRAKRDVLRLREHIRSALAAIATSSRPTRGDIDALNAATRAAPEWVELDPTAYQVKTRRRGSTSAQLLAGFARSALELISATDGSIRACEAPSCGMFYRPSRERQRWCSTQCGTRARVARSLRARSRAL